MWLNLGQLLYLGKIFFLAEWNVYSRPYQPGLLYTNPWDTCISIFSHMEETKWQTTEADEYYFFFFFHKKAPITGTGSALLGKQVSPIQVTTNIQPADTMSQML